MDWKLFLLLESIFPTRNALGSVFSMGKYFYNRNALERGFTTGKHLKGVLLQKWIGNYFCYWKAFFLLEMHWEVFLVWESIFTIEMHWKGVLQQENI